MWSVAIGRNMTLIVSICIIVWRIKNLALLFALNDENAEERASDRDREKKMVPIAFVSHKLHLTRLDVGFLGKYSQSNRIESNRYVCVGGYCSEFITEHGLHKSTYLAVFCLFWRSCRIAVTCKRIYKVLTLLFNYLRTNAFYEIRISSMRCIKSLLWAKPFDKFRILDILDAPLLPVFYQYSRPESCSKHKWRMYKQRRKKPMRTRVFPIQMNNSCWTVITDVIIEQLSNRE